LFERGDLQLALHIIDIVLKGENIVNAKDLLIALELKYDILTQKVKKELSFIASNILNNGRQQIKRRIKELGKK